MEVLADCGSLAADAEKPFDGASLDPIGVRRKRKREGGGGGGAIWGFSFWLRRCRSSRQQKRGGGGVALTVRKKVERGNRGLHDMGFTNLANNSFLKKYYIYFF